VQGLALETRSAQIDGVLKALLSKLEKEKTTIALGEGDSQYCENFAITVFTRADRVDRAGRADKNTAMTFYAASIFFEVFEHLASWAPFIPTLIMSSQAEPLRILQILNQFKTLEADLVDMQRYAAWKAADIRKALREGRTPTPGAPGDELAADSSTSGTPCPVPGSMQLHLVFAILKLIHSCLHTLCMPQYIYDTACKASLGHVFRMPDNRLPKKRLFGHVKGRRPAGLGRPRVSDNALVLEDCYSGSFRKYYSDAQNKPFWRGKTGPAHT